MWNGSVREVFHLNECCCSARECVNTMWKPEEESATVVPRLEPEEISSGRCDRYCTLCSLKKPCRRSYDHLGPCCCLTSLCIDAVGKCGEPCFGCGRDHVPRSEQCVKIEGHEGRCCCTNPECKAVEFSCMGACHICGLDSRRK